MGHIVWSVQEDGQDWGQVGGLDLFRVEVFGDPEKDDWNNILFTTLPVDLSEDALFEKKEEAFAKAEEVLTDFLSSIGAKWADEETK